MAKNNTKHTLQHLSSRKLGKEWAPEDPTSLFDDSLVKLAKLYKSKKDLPSTITQQRLWLQQLKASGNAPVDDIDDLFVRHTLLILITQIIAGDKKEGFVSWVPSNHKLVNEIEGIINQYDWRHRSTDIMRVLYTHFIPRKHRRSFGEYYTPDWLAEHICQEIIDERYVKSQLKNFKNGKKVNGVLDPFCGSGTFLVHAINRIKSLTESKLSEKNQVEFLSMMIHGMDIHPVAVEMTRANVKRLLPGINQINVYQGDSLLISRSDSSVFSNGGENIFLQSPGGDSIVIPKSFMKNIKTFVDSAREGKRFPQRFMSLKEKEILKEAYHSLIKIIKKESNGIWYWFIINQSAPILLEEKKVDRIISNPPWVALHEIQVESRKTEITNTAKDMKLYVGKEMAGNLDVAMIGMVRSSDLYLKGDRAGWVLPQGAISGANNWANLNKLYQGRITDMWDLGRLAFSNTPSCAILTGKNETPTRIIYRMKKGVESISGTDSWSDVKEKFTTVNKVTFPQCRSAYTGRHGASLQPMNLVRVETQTQSANKIEFTTYNTFKEPWKSFGSRRGVVPVRFVKTTLISSHMFPFHARYSNNIIPMLENGEWDTERLNNAYWKDAQSIYSRNKGKDKTTPKTLEDRLDYNGNITKQMGIKKTRVVYNAVGDYLYAAIIEPEVICGVGIVSVETRGKTEALFLSALLNASCLHNAFIAARNTDRNFHMHILDKIPLPRYDGKNEIHKNIVKLSKKCERKAKKIYESYDYGEHKMRYTIRNALEDLQKDMQKEIVQILPDYV